jgi:hypothetical protein
MQREYYAMFDDERRGPFTNDQLLAAGLQADTFVWFEGSRDWLPAEDVPELAALLKDDGFVPRDDVDEGVELWPASYLETPSYYGNVLWILSLGWSIFVNYQGDSFGRGFAIFGVLGAVVLWYLTIRSYMMMWYRAWKVVQDGHAHLSPKSAIVWLFVPVFNIYWIFRASVGLVRDLDAYAARHRLEAPPAPFFSAAAVSIYFVWSLAPFVGLPGTLLNLFVFPYFMHRIYSTAVCFCTENRKTSKAAAKDPSANKSMALAIIAAILFPIGFLMCASPCFITPFPYHMLFTISPHVEAAMVEPALQRDRRLRERALDNRDREHLRQLQIEALSDVVFLGLDMNVRPFVVAGLGTFGAVVFVFAFGMTPTNSELPKTEERYGNSS